MLGDTVREARIKKGLTQAKLARLAGVSRRHLAALEKGANVSVLVLRKVASVLDLTEIQLGDLSLRATPGGASGVNVPLLADTIREAMAGTLHAQAILAKAEDLLTGNQDRKTPPPGGPSAHFPPLRPLRLHAALRETANPVEVRTSGTLEQGKPIDQEATETLVVPSTLMEKGELLFRVTGDGLRMFGIEAGDLLVVELRPTGRAASGELVVARVGNNVHVGRWWQKHGQKALMGDGLTEIATGKTRRSLRVVAVVNQIVRL